MKKVTVTEEVALKGSYDVLVAGGGVAGVAAAVAAARRGKRVLLLEKTVALGGLATIGLINLFVPMCNGRGTQIVKGMAEEFLRLSIKYGWDTIPDEWKNGDPGEGAKTRYVCKYSAPIFSMLMTNLLKDEGVDILFDSVVSKPIMKDGHCEGVIVDSKGGRDYFEAKVIVDTTGDADIMYRAGVPCRDGKNYYTYLMFGVTMNSMKKAIETGDVANAYAGFSGGGINLHGTNQPSDVPLYKGTTADEITDYLVRNHKDAIERIKDQDRKSRDIMQMPAMCQFRETRCIIGDATLTGDETYLHSDTSIGAMGDFEIKDRLYEIPYGTLVKTGFDNLITAGRTASATGWGWDCLRVIPPAIITGQAAGEASVIAIDSGVPIAEVDISLLQKRLSEGNVMIHFDDALIPKDKSKEEEFKFGHL